MEELRNYEEFNEVIERQQQVLKCQQPIILGFDTMNAEMVRNKRIFR
ncbi:hypothetical protein ACYSNR_17555 [Enterococcus sp. LJL128]